MQCILCGNVDATDQAVDHGNRIAINCPASDCGSFEISRRALAELCLHPARRPLFQRAVMEAKQKGLGYEIIFDIDGMIGRPLPAEHG